jgi:hypothetical protein
VDDGMLIGVVDGGQGLLLELLSGGGEDMPEHGTGELKEETIRPSS